MQEDDLKKPKEKSIWVIAGEYSQVGMILPASVFVGYVIGYLLDKQFGTTYLYMVFMLLGIVAGFVSIFRFIKKHED
ncbi:MAG TPA: AtpZ/AtpI family protein [Bryobacteraceae bacterium]|nr:AtpZ/AtpI family protein [Bryobacteraceae bacterium]